MKFIGPPKCRWPLPLSESYPVQNRAKLVFFFNRVANFGLENTLSYKLIFKSQFCRWSYMKKVVNFFAKSNFIRC